VTQSHGSKTGSQLLAGHDCQAAAGEREQEALLWLVGFWRRVFCCPEYYNSISAGMFPCIRYKRRVLWGGRMYRNWLLVTALLIAIYSIIIFLHHVVESYRTRDFSSKVPGLSLMFLVKNQQDIIEGIIRTVFAATGKYPVEVMIVDAGSVDQTAKIITHLKGIFPELRFLNTGKDGGVPKKISNLCHGEIIYFFDLTVPVNYGLMSRTVESVLNGSRASLYRTRVLYKNGTKGRCTRS